MIADAPALPPYSFLDPPALLCIVEASRKWEVPELLIHAVISKEGGKPGSSSQNRNGTVDLGPAQINTANWETYFKGFGISQAALRSDVCANVQAATWLLKRNFLVSGGDWFRAVMAYHIGVSNWTRRPNAVKRGQAYAGHVFKIWGYLHEYSGKYTSSSYTQQQYNNNGD